MFANDWCNKNGKASKSRALQARSSLALLRDAPRSHNPATWLCVRLISDEKRSLSHNLSTWALRDARHQNSHTLLSWEQGEGQVRWAKLRTGQNHDCARVLSFRPAFQRGVAKERAKQAATTTWPPNPQVRIISSFLLARLSEIFPWSSNRNPNHVRTLTSCYPPWVNANWFEDPRHELGFRVLIFQQPLLYDPRFAHGSVLVVWAIVTLRRPRLCTECRTENQKRHPYVMLNLCRGTLG